MLHQIALWQNIPALRDHLKGFIDETQTHLADAADEERHVKAKYHKFPLLCDKHMKAIRSVQSKYGDRLNKAEKAIESIKNLERCLNE